MLHRVPITRLNLCDLDIPPNPNHVEVNWCARRLLLMLEVESCADGQSVTSNVLNISQLKTENY